MNFTPVLDELLICQIASTHHENTEFDHCFSPVAMGDCAIDLTKSRKAERLRREEGLRAPGEGEALRRQGPARRGVADAFFPLRASGRVVADPGVSGRQ